MDDDFVVTRGFGEYRHDRSYADCKVACVEGPTQTVQTFRRSPCKPPAKAPVVGNEIFGRCLSPISGKPAAFGGPRHILEFMLPPCNRLLKSCATCTPALCLPGRIVGILHGEWWQ